MWDTESGERLFALEGDRRLFGQISARGSFAVSSCGRVLAACGGEVDDSDYTGTLDAIVFADAVESLAL